MEKSRCSNLRQSFERPGPSWVRSADPSSDAVVVSMTFLATTNPTTATARILDKQRAEDIYPQFPWRLGMSYRTVGFSTL
jgi:hypothetical protein